MSTEFYVGQHVRVTRECSVYDQPWGKRHDLRAGQTGGVTVVHSTRLTIFFSGFEQFEVSVPVSFVEPVENALLGGANSERTS